MHPRNLFTLLLLFGSAIPAFAEPNPTTIPTPTASILKGLPESLEDLKEIQKQTRLVLDKVIPCTVGLRVGGASGSGVIINKEGIVLTAGHVSGKPGQEVGIILHDGKIIKGKTLGCNRGIDSGMIQITDKVDLPYVEMGNAGDLKKGSWCIAVGHPNGYIRGRSPVVRLGRVLGTSKETVSSDCALVGGDSGGPLFDMEGKVIGIHSRIGATLNDNIHVPVDTYRDTWDRLVKSEEWGGNRIGFQPTRDVPYLGVSPKDGSKEPVLSAITENSPAAKAGFMPGDVILKFDNKDIKTYDEFVELLGKKKIGDKVDIEVKRGNEVIVLKPTIGRRGGN